jgi:predicted NBD/HSP70 family sugar kinase
MTQYLAVDVGGTNIKYAAMDENAEILEKGEYATPMEDGLNGFLKVLHTIYANHGRDAKAVVMSAPGRIDADTGYFYTSGALKYIDKVNLKERVKEFISVPFAVENDAKAAALAELWKGSMQGIQNGIVMTLGTGIGGAVIIDGRLYRGSTFAAGEFSGMPTDYSHAPYDLGSMWAVENSVLHLVADYAQRTHQDPKKCNGRILFDAANKNDPDALAAIDNFCQHLAAGIMNLQFVLDVQKIAIGGGISKQPILIASLKKQIHAYYDTAAEQGMPACIPEITACTFGNDANMIGALYHYLHMHH